MKEEIKKILQFVKTRRFCVLATADKNGKPEAAIVCYFPKDDFSIFFFSNPKTRKMKNLKENSQASVVIEDIKSKVEVQIDGKITILEDNKSQKAKEFILNLAPDMKHHINKRPVVFFQFKPIWIRYCDFSKEPDETYEFNNFIKT